MGLLKKRISKRITLKDRYKIEKKVAEHNRKQRRQSKKDEKSGATQRRALRKDPGIPNLWPFKEQLLRQLEAKKERGEERQSEINLRRKMDLDSAEARALAHAEREAEQAGQEEGRSSNSRHAGSILKSVIEDANVVLQILDARDPLGSRSAQIEEMLLAKDRKMVFVLNKADLVPESALVGWIKWFKSQRIQNLVGVIPFAANTQKQRSNLKRVDGAELLIKHLKMLNRGTKTILTVGVVGVPNVGKSSVVNSLKMQKAVISSAQAGSTKSNQSVLIDSKLELIDTPGVVVACALADGSEQVRALRKCLEPVVEDALKAVEAVVRSAPERFMVHYGLSKFGTPTEFLIQVATKFGKRTKGGALNLEAAAKQILIELQKGKVKLFVAPPTSSEDRMEDEEAEAPVVLEGFGEDFEFADEDEAISMV